MRDLLIVQTFFLDLTHSIADSLVSDNFNEHLMLIVLPLKYQTPLFVKVDKFALKLFRLS